MEFKVNNKTFFEALNIGGSMAGKAKTAPILECAKISLRGENAFVSSHDLECAVSKKVSIISSDEDFAFCINPRDLSNILRTIKDDEVSMDVKDDTCVIIHSKGECFLPVFPAEDFPTPPKEDNMSNVEVDASMLYDWFSQAQKFVGIDKIRPTLSGVFLYVQDGEIGVAASDSHRMFHNYAPNIMDTSLDLNAIIPVKAILAVCSMSSNNTNIQISFGKQNIVFRGTDTTILCRLIVGSYPRFKQVIPRESSTLVNIKREDLQNSVTRSLLTANSQSFFIKMSIKEDGTLLISSEDLGFRKKSNELVTLSSFDGYPIEIGAKGSHFLDCLSSVESDSITLGFSSPQRPILFRDENNPNKNIILMPSKVA